MRPRQDASAKTEEGRRLFQAGDDEGAVAAFSEAVSLYPRSLTAYSLRSQVYHRLGQPVNATADMQAIAAIRRSAVSPPGEEAVAAVEEGRRLLDAGDATAAIDQFTSAITNEPDFVEAYRARADAFRMAGNESEAAADMEEAATIEKTQQAFTQPARERPAARPVPQLTGSIFGSTRSALLGAVRSLRRR